MAAALAVLDGAATVSDQPLPPLPSPVIEQIP
jgi:hypothetical protein